MFDQVKTKVFKLEFSENKGHTLESILLYFIYIIIARQVPPLSVFLLRNSKVKVNININVINASLLNSI